MISSVVVVPEDVQCACGLGRLWCRDPGAVSVESEDGEPLQVDDLKWRRQERYWGGVAAA